MNYREAAEGNLIGVLSGKVGFDPFCRIFKVLHMV